MQVEARLIPAAAAPQGMAFVPGSEYRMASWSRPTDRRVRLSDYFIDKYEVSNEDYKAFINAGGYARRDLWSHPFVNEGRTLSWDEAMALFVDRTGLPGPRQWSNQSVPEGKADYPVTDVSWFEAEAFAAFRGKRLPTVFQWEKAARNGAIGPAGIVVMPWGLFYPGDDLEARANFGSGPQPVTSGEFGMSRFGARNMGQRGRMDAERQHRRLPRGGRRLGRPFVHVCAVRRPAGLLQLGQVGLPAVTDRSRRCR
jgi:formylglycine-generating enzyme required for sulfatase activity